MIIDRRINNLEKELSYYSRYPVIGAVPATLKIVLGVTQCVSAFVLSFLALIYSLPTRNTEPFKRCVEYVVHGLANSIAGIIEIIPLLSYCTYLARKELQQKDLTPFKVDDQDYFLSTGNKFTMAYDSLLRDDFRIHDKEQAISYTTALAALKGREILYPNIDLPHSTAMVINHFRDREKAYNEVRHLAGLSP